MEDLGYDPYDNSEEVQGALSAIPSATGATRLQGAIAESNARVKSLEDRYSKTQKETETLYRRQKEILDAASQRLLSKEGGPGRREALLALAAAMGKPTHTGRFSETVGNVAGAGADILTQRRQGDEARRQLADKYSLDSVNAGLGATGADERQALTLLNSELNRQARLETAGSPRSSPLPAGVQIINGTPYWPDENGQMQPHTVEQMYAMVSGSKASGQFPYKTQTGPFGPVMAPTLPGAPGPGAPVTPPISLRQPPVPGPGSASPALLARPGAVPPPVASPVGPSAAPASAPAPLAAPSSPGDPSPRELESVEPLFTPFASLPTENSLMSSKSAPILRRQAALAFRSIPKFPLVAPGMGPQAIQLKAQIEEDAKRGTKISTDLRDRGMASEDILKSYSKMYADLQGGIRTGKVSIFLTTLEEAMSGVLPEGVTEDFIDSARKSREQSFDKLALDALTRTLKATYGARITNLDLDTAIRAAPGRSISEKASTLLMGVISDKAQEQLFKQGVWEEYRYRGGTADGFDSWYRSKLSPYFENETRRKIMSGMSTPTVDPAARRQELMDELKRRQAVGQP